MKKKLKIISIILLNIIVIFLLIIIYPTKNIENDSNNLEYQNEVDDWIYSNEVLTIENSMKESNDNSGVLRNYQDYFNFISKNNLESYTNNEITEEDFKTKDYIYYYLHLNKDEDNATVSDVIIGNNIAYIEFKIIDCEETKIDSKTNLYIIPIEKEQDILEIKHFADLGVTVDKPILYLYPTTKMNVKVQLKYDNRIKTSYPKYNNYWEITAHPNGDLYDKFGNYYYALYWDEKSQNNIDFKEGFYVTSENAISFLEEKLSILGLNDKERNEFIMYWLPKLEDNKKSLVYFEQTEEREKNNQLIITPKPDSLLRINIHIKKVDKKTDIKEQKLETFKRNGFTAVEWGGVIHSQ